MFLLTGLVTGVVEGTLLFFGDDNDDLKFYRVGFTLGGTGT